MAAPKPSAKQIFISGSQSGGGMFYLDNYLGVAEGGLVDLVNDQLVRLPPNECRYVMLANWNVEKATVQTYRTLSGGGLYEDAGLEIYYGFNGILIAQLFASQSSPLLPVNNTNQICAKLRAGVTSGQIYYAYFR